MRSDVLPYGRHWVDEDDIDAVVEVLRSDWLTTGPAVEAFENAAAEATGSAHAVALSSGTAALHAVMFALDVGPGDEVIVPTMTFAATANCVVYQGAQPVFADVDPDTLLLTPKCVEARITPSTKAIIAVDYAGQPCDYDALRTLAKKHGLHLVSDACHSLGATYKKRSVGTLADLTVFSFHPVKHITTGEGGMITTADQALAARIRRFRNHGINSDHRHRAENGSWFYEMTELGYNYRISDIQCALGSSQLRKLPAFLTRRREIAHRYNDAFANHPSVAPLAAASEVEHAFHLYVVRVLKLERDVVFSALRARGIAANVHYIPVHLHPFYRRRFGFGAGECPEAEAAYQSILSLPIFPRMSDAEVDRVIGTVLEVSQPGF